MSLKADILDTKQWLDANRGEYISPAIWEDCDSHTKALEACADQAEELEKLVNQAFELLTGEWDPDDIDRHKFLIRLERAIP